MYFHWLGRILYWLYFVRNILKYHISFYLIFWSFSFRKSIFLILLSVSKLFGTRRTCFFITLESIKMKNVFNEPCWCLYVVLNNGCMINEIGVNLQLFSFCVVVSFFFGGRTKNYWRDKIKDKLFVVFLVVKNPCTNINIEMQSQPFNLFMTSVINQCGKTKKTLIWPLFWFNYNKCVSFNIISLQFPSNILS